MLRKHGFSDAGAFIIPPQDGRRNLEAHFWQDQYNQPILEFFKDSSNADATEIAVKH